MGLFTMIFVAALTAVKLAQQRTSQAAIDGWRLQPRLRDAQAQTALMIRGQARQPSMYRQTPSALRGRLLEQFVGFFESSRDDAQAVERGDSQIEALGVGA